MESSQATVFTWLYISWGVITVVLVVLLSYRATLSSGNDQTFSDATKQDPYQQEQRLIARSSRLAGEIIVLSVISGALLLTCVGISI
jgi:hypothetical protein